MKIYATDRDIYLKLLNKNKELIGVIMENNNELKNIMYIENDQVQIYVKDKHEIKHYRCLEKEVDRDGCEILSLEQHDKELLKEFALEIINWSLPKYGEDIQIQVAIDFETKIRELLKERGVE